MAIDIDKLFKYIEAGQDGVDKKIDDLGKTAGKEGGTISIPEMMKLQVMMNRLSQLSEMTSSTLAALNSAINRSAQNIK